MAPYKKSGRILPELPLLIIMTAAVIFMSVQAGRVFAEDTIFLMATTTSTDDTGLLDYLMPMFTTRTGIDVQWVATGTGRALSLAEECDVDVILVHAPKAEIVFVENGYGIDRKQIMYNDFVLIGPPEDSGAIKGKKIAEALQTIKATHSLFISRGDNSGTNKKEKALWNLAHVSALEHEVWYMQSGKGMLATIKIAAQLKGYTLTDRGTYIKYQSDAGGETPLIILVEGDAELLNQYSIIAVNPKHCPQAKYNRAMALSAWMAGDEAQRLIGEFKLVGKQLFIPNADRE